MNKAVIGTAAVRLKSSAGDRPNVQARPATA